MKRKNMRSVLIMTLFAMMVSLFAVCVFAADNTVDSVDLGSVDLLQLSGDQQGDNEVVAKAKEALEEVIAKAKKTAEDAKDKYSEESYKALQDAISAAEDLIKDGSKATKEDLGKALVKIEAAKKAVEEEKAKQAAEEKAAKEAGETLNNILEDVKKIEHGNYTDESYKALQDAIAEAEALAKDEKATSEQLKAASDKVTAAKTGLKEKEEASAEVDVKVGDTINYKKNTYKVTSDKSNTVAFTKAENVKRVAVPATIKINGKTYKVTTVNAKAFRAKKIRSVTIGKNVKRIGAKAFYGSKATTITLKTKLLKKSKVKDSLKGSKVKAVKVRITKKASKTNRTYAKKYKKYFTKSNAGRKVTVK